MDGDNHSMNQKQTAVIKRVSWNLKPVKLCQFGCQISRKTEFGKNGPNQKSKHR